MAKEKHYIYVLDDYDLKDKFFSYCKKNYNNFLQKNTGTPFLHKQLETIKSSTNPEQQIKKSVDKNFNRLRLFLHHKYNPRYQYEGEYSENLWNYNVNDPYEDVDLSYYPEIKFINEHHKYQERYLSKYRTLIRDFCIDEGLIQCDKIFFPSSLDFVDSGKSYGYRIHPRFYSSEYSWDKKYITFNSSLIKGFKSRKSYLRKNCSRSCESNFRYE